MFSISPKFDNAVTLRGNVAEPGRYPFRPGMRVRDLIPNKEFLLTRGFWNSQNADGNSPVLLARAETGGSSEFSIAPTEPISNVSLEGSSTKPNAQAPTLTGTSSLPWYQGKPNSAMM